MIEYRSLLNSDPPGLVRLWNSQTPQRGRAQPISSRLLEFLVFSKHYFDRHGLVVACENGEIVGFVHAGFGPNEQQTDICTDMGVICLLMTAERPDNDQIAGQLIERAEAYLKGRGAQVLYAGAIRPLDPFYLGLYGGSEMPGVLVSDTRALNHFVQHGYAEIDRSVVLHRKLKQVRSVVDRRQMQVRRRYRVDVSHVDAAPTWWQAATAPPADMTRYEILPRAGGPPCGSLVTWFMEPLARGWGLQAIGLTQLEVSASLRRKGLATFLTSEVIRQLQTAGVALIETQTMQHNTAALGLYDKLGFRKVDEGVVLRKEQ